MSASSSLFSHPLEGIDPADVRPSASDDECTSASSSVATPSSSRPPPRPANLRLRMGPFDVLLSPTGTPKHGAAESLRIKQDIGAEVLRALRIPLERSGELVDDAFVRRWVGKGSSNLRAELEAHAAWRADFVNDCSGYGVREARIGALLEEGVVFFQGNASAGFAGHPLLVFKAERYDASRFASQLPACLMYAMDAAITCADPELNPKRQVVWLFDLQNVSRKNCSIEFLESVFTLFQGHYPECLRRLYFVNAPFLFWGLWAMASVFVDVKTREKIVFCGITELRDSVRSPDVVPEAYGGQAKLRSLRRAVAIVKRARGPAVIPDDDDDVRDGAVRSRVPVLFDPFKSTLFWLLFSVCLTMWLFVKPGARTPCLSWEEAWNDVDFKFQEEPEFSKNSQPDVVMETHMSWVSCDSCHKWRRIPLHLADGLDDEARWTCEQNPDPKFNACSTPQEFEDDVIDEMIAQEEAAAVAAAEKEASAEKRKARRPTIWQQVSESLFTHRKRNEYNDDETMVCGCSRDQIVPCGDGCINRELFQECSEHYCPHGSKCTNRRFQLKEYAPLDVKRAGKKGFGLFAKGDMKAGTFLIEYVGEVLEEEEYERRKQFYEMSHQRHYYFMNIGNGETVDATRMGGVGRFINHSCEPNCETQKWTVNGEVTIGLFTKVDVKAGTELTFDYNFQRYGDKPVKCLCGAASCRGIIGGERETADSLGLDITEGQDDDDLDDLEPIMVTEADQDSALKQILEREVGLGWENGWSSALQVKVDELAHRKGVTLPAPGEDGCFDVEFLKAAARAAMSMSSAPAGRKPKGKAPKTPRRMADPDWGSQSKDQELRGSKSRDTSIVSRKKSGSGARFERSQAAGRRELLPPLKRVVINGIVFEPSKNSEVQRHLYEMLTPSGRLEDTTKEGVHKFLHLFNLCKLDNDTLVRFRCIDLSILIETVIRTDGLQAKHMFVAQGLLRQLFMIMVSNRQRLKDEVEILPVYRKALKILGTLPFSADNLLQRLNAKESFADFLKIFATYSDYELKNSAYNLLRKWSLPFPDTVRRGYDRDREDRVDRERRDSYKRPFESSKRTREWEGGAAGGGNGNGYNGHNSFGNGNGHGASGRDREGYNRSGVRRNDFDDRNGYDTHNGFNNGHNGYNNDGYDGPSDAGNRNGSGRGNRWDSEQLVPGPPAGPDFSPMTDEEEEGGIVIVGADDKNEDVFAHVSGNLVLDPFDAAGHVDEAAPVAMVFVSNRAWATPHDPDFDRFVTACCEKELSKHEGPLLTRKEAGLMFSKIRKAIINGEKKAFEDREASGAPHHVLDETKVESRVKQYVKEKVDRFIVEKQQAAGVQAR